MFARAGTGAPTFFESLSGIDARRIPGGSKTGEKACHGGSSNSKEKDRDIEAQIGLGGQRVGWHGGDQAFQHGIADTNTKCSASKSEEQALCEQLGEDGAAAGAERAANRELLLAGHAASQ